MKNLLRTLSAIAFFLPWTAGADTRLTGGLIEPTAEQKASFEAISEEYMVPLSSAALPSRVVNTIYLPPVWAGSQGNLGICGSICITYFTATHQLAKARGWTAPGHDGDWSKVTSPAWGVLMYPHAVEGGAPNGAAPSVVIDEIMRTGIRSYEDFPYSDTMDYTVFPEFEDRAKALHWSAKSAIRINDVHSPAGIMSLKHLLAGGDIAATGTDYSPTLFGYLNPATHPDVDNEVITRKGSPGVGHAMTIVGYDDNKTYTDPNTGAIKKGAFLLVNSWSTGWGVSVPEVGTGGFVWIPYELEGFLRGAYTLYFPTEDTVPELYGDMRLTDFDGDWKAEQRSAHFWYHLCKYELPGQYGEVFPDFNSYNNSDSYAFAFDASSLSAATFPRLKIDMFTMAQETDPEGTVAFALYASPDENGGPTTQGSTEVWAHFPTLPYREHIFSPISESIPDLGIATGRGTMAPADLNGDGASEFAASYLEAAPPGQNFGPARLVIGRNDGSGNFTLEQLPADDAYGQVLWVDIDLDADLDLLLSSHSKTAILINDGSNNFSTSAVELPASGMGGISVADFNRDGLPDLLLANAEEGLLLMRHLGDGSFEKHAFGRAIPRNFYGVYATGVAAGDVNGDSLPDFVFWDYDDSGYGSNRLILGLNTGDLDFEFRSLPIVGDLDGVAMAFADFDNDGCDDLAWSASERFGVLQGASNGWMKAVPVEPGIKPVFGGNIAWGDINCDGTLDLLVTGRKQNFSSTTGSTQEDADLGFYGNKFYLLSYVNGYFVESGYQLTGVSGSTRSTLLAAMDVDADGDLDFFSAGYRGKTGENKLTVIDEALCRSSLFLNDFETFTSGQRTNTPPSAPTQFTATPSPNKISFSWSGAADAETPDEGLHYLLEVGTSANSGDLYSGTIVAQNTGLLLKSNTVLNDLPSGTLYWRVRTVDSSHAMSAWSANQTTSMPGNLAQSRVSITSAEGGITTPATGEYLLGSGGSLEISAEAAAGYQFVEWLVNGSSMGGNPVSLSPGQQWTEVSPIFSAKSATPEVNDWQQLTFNAGTYFPTHKWGSSEFATASLNGYLYMFPGYGESTSAWRSSNGTSWQPGNFMGQAGFTLPYAQATVWNQKIWLLAGKSIYSATQGGGGALSWTTETTSAPWSADLQYAGFTAFAGKLWVVSGYFFGGFSDIYSSSNGKDWSWSASIPWSPQTYTRLVVVDDTLVAMTSATSFEDGQVWATTDGTNWTQQSAAAPWKRPESSWLSERFISAAYFDGLIHVVSMPNEHFISPDKGISWVKVHPDASDASHFTESGMGELVSFSDKLYLLGGGGDDMMSKEYWALSGSSGGSVSYALNISVDGEGGTTLPPPGAHFDQPGVYPLQARPDPGFAFVSWTGPVADAQNPQTTINLDANVSVSATFQATDNGLTAPGHVTLTTQVSPAGSGDIRSAENANATLSSALEDGSTRVQAIASEGWVFSHWQGSSVQEMLSAKTAIIPADSSPVSITACFTPTSMGSVDARGNSNALVDTSGNQWFWGSPVAGAEAHLWNSPNGESVPPFAFNQLDFHLGQLPSYMLTSMGTLLRSKSEGLAVSLDNSVLTFPLHRFVEISTCGNDEWAYALAIDADGKVWGWGSNAYGQLGDGTQVDRTEPVAVMLPGSETITKVSAGNTFAMALALSGKVYVWGANSYGQTGPAGTINPIPLQMPGLTNIRDIAAGANHAVALDTQGSLRTWGQDLYGQVSGRTGDDKEQPFAFESLSANMAYHNVRLTMSDSFGNTIQTGGGTTLPQAGDYVVRPYEEFFVQAENGDRYQFSHWEGAVLDDGSNATTAKARPGSAINAVFDLNSQSTAKLDLSMNYAEAGTLTPNSGITEYAQGELIQLQTQPAPSWQFDQWIINGHSYSEPSIQIVMDRDIQAEAVYSPQAFRTTPVPGFLNSWGQPIDYEDHYKFNAAYTGPLFVDATASNFSGHTRLYLARDGSLWYADLLNQMEPVPGESNGLSQFNNVKRIAATNSGFMLAVRIDGTVWVWGNVPGEAQPLTRPIQVAGLHGGSFSQITGVGDNLLFLHSDGTLSSWGTDATLTGTGVSHTALTTVAGISGLKQLAANAFSALALKSDGTVWAWGNNYHELLGRSWDELNSSNVPVQVPGLSGITRIFSGGFAIDSQQRAWVWGRDNGGNKGLEDDQNQSIVPPKLHPGFPAGALTASQNNPNYIVLENGEMWAYGVNTPYAVREPGGPFSFIVFKVKADTIDEPIVHQRLTVSCENGRESWISHVPGTHTYLDNDQVLLWADTPITWQCDGWLINGSLDNRSTITLLMEQDYSVEPRFSKRPLAQLPAPALSVASAQVDQNQLNAVVRLPIRLSDQDYITPEGLQFTLHIPNGLPEPTVTIPDELLDAIEVVEEWEVPVNANGVRLKLLMTASNDLFATQEMTLATLNFDLEGITPGDYPISIVELQQVMPATASEDNGEVAIPLGTEDGLLQLVESDRCEIKLVAVPDITPVESLSDDAMKSLPSWNSLRDDLDKYLEIWVRSDSGSDIFSCAFDLSISGGAAFTKSNQFFINKENLSDNLAPDGSSLTSMGGLIADAKIVSYNDFASDPYTSGDWLRIALIPVSGDGGTQTVSMTNAQIELIGDSSIETFTLADQNHDLEIRPNSAPTASVGQLSTGSSDMLRIKPVLDDLNPQDISGIRLTIKRYPVHGYVLVDPNDPQAFIYHPPQNGSFSGTTSFEFCVSDGYETSPTYTVNISVNNAPRFVGLPDYVDSIEGAGLSQRIQVEDADTAANQLVFSLEFAPAWLKVTNNNNYSATLSGIPEANRNGYEVFSLCVYDPLSQQTTRTTMLLITQSEGSGVILTVLNGTGGGWVTPGTARQISASPPASGEGFICWVGDIAYLDNSQSANPTVTIPGHDISVMAVYIPLQAMTYSDWVDLMDLQGNPGDTSPAGDGITNLEKYALGLSPDQAYDESISYWIEMAGSPTESDRLVIRYNKLKLATDVGITPVWSASLDPSDWRSDLIEHTLIEETDSLQTWEVSLPIDSSNPLFMKLNYQLLQE